jgi:serine/threonine-protein kinase
LLTRWSRAQARPIAGILNHFSSAARRIRDQINHDETRFEQEARTVAALNHPNICQIYDLGPDYLVMEYVEGVPLRGPLRTDEALPVAIQIASALEEAHNKRILHRDLKPGNVLVTGKGAAKLLDFGLARPISRTGETETMAVMGTPLYMSPEQTEGQPIDERSDIFSVGAMLYEMLSGRRAFDTLGALLRDDPTRLDGPAGEIALRCLAKRPAERFQSIDQVRAALQRLVTKSPSDEPSIAVLPFANMSGDKEQEFFSDGLAEEIINLLAQIPGLKVTARTSAFAFRGKEQDIRNIARALDVQTILEGSVRRAGNRIRVTAQLINAADGYHLWSQPYDREMADVFDVQDEIATAIADALQPQLTQTPAAIERYRPNLPAYEAYLQARYLIKNTVEAFTRAMQYYEKAIALDPKFASAYSDMASLFAALAVLGLRSPDEVLPPTRTWAQKALELNPSLADAHALLAVVAALWDYDWIEAESRFARALAREPVPPVVRMYYGIYLSALGRPLEAKNQFQRAVAEDPLFPLYRHWMAQSLWAMGENEDATREFRYVLESNENFPNTYTALGLYYASKSACVTVC